MGLGDRFGEISELYDETRAGYPQELADDVMKLSGSTHKSKVLEVGCGSGKATIMFAKKGCSVIGLDISDELISIAKEKTNDYPNISYKLGSFEETDFQDKFDLIISAQAWHWLDQNTSYDKAYNLLVDQGSLVLFWKYQDTGKSDFVKAVRELYGVHCSMYPPDFGNTDQFERHLSSDSFKTIMRKEYHSVLKYSAKKYFDFIQTISWGRSLSDSGRALFNTDLTGLLIKQNNPIQVPYKYVLLVAKK